jgi:CheY-like chemotaxis protein
VAGKGPVAQPANAATALAGRKVLIIDDDIRNIFALSGALEEHGIDVVDAESGKSGLDLLRRQPDIDAVLMDIMMPDLDGLDSIRLIRGLKQFRDLPIIAVTARAMNGDRESCIEAGATDYIAKPVNVGQLLTLLQDCLVR